jgi:hypothetical protein
MSNSNMRAKADKARRQKRLFPRHLASDYIPTGKPPNMLVMRELKERTRSLAFDEEYIEYLVTRAILDAKGQHISSGRREVSAHIQRIKDTAPALTCVTLSNSVACKAFLFYNEERNRFILFEENKVKKFIRTSMVYMDRKRCLDSWMNDTTRWVYFSSVHPPTKSSTE